MGYLILLQIGSSHQGHCIQSGPTGIKMLVYTATKQEFCEDVRHNTIDEKIRKNFEAILGFKTSKSEMQSWRNSMPYMSNVIAAAEIPDDAGVAIEYRIPQTSKRVDFIVTGTDDAGVPAVVIVELKQWQEAGITDKDAVVETLLGGAWRETTHPSYQAWSYAQLMRDFNEYVYTHSVQLHPCAYLHNCEDGVVLKHAKYKQHVDLAPVFLRHDTKKLAEFIAKYVRKGDRGKSIYDIEKGRIRPSKDLSEHLASLLQGNREFVMIDDQKLVYETALLLSAKASAGKKYVLLVNGGPGTGKSVVAINLLVELTGRGLVTQYVTRNAAPRAVYESKLASSMRKSRISNLFKGSGSFTETESGTFDVLIVDEAHRLNQKSGMFQNMGENQVKELISASKLCVFFLDEDQKVTLSDIGSRDEVMKHAASMQATVVEHTLTSQFRCNGSDGYLAWLDHTLQIRATANETLEGADYEFVVCDNPSHLKSMIVERNGKANRSRMVAGYCWPWVSKKNTKLFDFDFPEYEFTAQWNLDDDGMLWLIKPDSVNQIGCIHTCQGLELEYVGVILGPDLVIREGEVLTDASQRAGQDKSVHGYKSRFKANPVQAKMEADEIIKNTYRVLMSRGQKGCFVWSVDPETNYWLRTSAG
jgi:DUF2075 family protein